MPQAGGRSLPPSLTKPQADVEAQPGVAPPNPDPRSPAVGNSDQTRRGPAHRLWPRRSGSLDHLSILQLGLLTYRKSTPPQPAFVRLSPASCGTTAPRPYSISSRPSGQGNRGTVPWLARRDHADRCRGYYRFNVIEATGFNQDCSAMAISCSSFISTYPQEFNAIPFISRRLNYHFFAKLFF